MLRNTKKQEAKNEIDFKNKRKKFSFQCQRRKWINKNKTTSQEAILGAYDLPNDPCPDKLPAPV